MSRDGINERRVDYMNTLLVHSFCQSSNGTRLVNVPEGLGENVM